MTSNVAPSALVEQPVELGRAVVVAANAVVLGQYDPNQPQTRICDFASIGANATIRAGVTIGRSAQVMPGAVVTRSVPPLAIVDGFPGQVVGYVSTLPDDAYADDAMTEDCKVQTTSVARVTKHRLTLINDPRGNLVPGEFESLLPFTPKRFFMVMDVPSSEIRGEHAHLECHQFLIAVKGSVCVVADDGINREEFLLDTPKRGIYLPSMIWGTQYRYSQDCVLLVFASENYQAADYIRTYDEFLDRCSLERASDSVQLKSAPITAQASG